MRDASYYPPGLVVLISYLLFICISISDSRAGCCLVTWIWPPNDFQETKDRRLVGLLFSLIGALWSKIRKNTDKIAIQSIIHCPTSEGVSEVSERASE